MNFFTILIFSSSLSLGNCSTTDHKAELNSANLSSKDVSIDSTMVTPATSYNTNSATAIKNEKKNNLIPDQNQAKNRNEQKTINPINVKLTTDQFPDDKLFDKLLKLYVSATGVVNYKGLKTKEADFDQYLADLGKATPTSKWSREIDQ